MVVTKKKVKTAPAATQQKAKTLYLVKSKTHYDGTTVSLYAAKPKVVEQQKFRRTNDGDWEPDGAPAVETDGNSIHSFCSSFGKSTGLSLDEHKIYKVTMSIEDVTPAKVVAPPVTAKVKK